MKRNDTINNNRHNDNNTDNDDEIRDQEQQQQVSTISTDEKSVECRVTVWHGWFQQIRFYKVALLYMGTRLTINLTQVYIPNYLQETLRLPKVGVIFDQETFLIFVFVSKK